MKGSSGVAWKNLFFGNFKKASSLTYQCKQVTQYDTFLASGQTSTIVTMTQLQSLLVVSLFGGYLVHCTVP